MFLLLNVYYVSLPVRLGPMDDFLLRDLPVKDTHALSLTGYIGHDAEWKVSENAHIESNCFSAHFSHYFNTKLSAFF